MVYHWIPGRGKTAGALFLMRLPYMHMTTRILLALFLALIAGCGTAPSLDQTFVRMQNGALRHSPSHFVFPAQLAGFTRGQTTVFSKAGDDVSVGYNDGRAQIAATLYVYPAGGASLKAADFLGIIRAV